MYGEPLDSWIQNLNTYFKTCLMNEYKCLPLIGNHLEGMAQAYWQCRNEGIEIYNGSNKYKPTTSEIVHIDT